MQATDIQVSQLFAGPKQFIVPLFQRDYSWGTKQCDQLLQDIVRVGSAEGSARHFLGSVVYIAAEDSAAGFPRWLLIDGQQRITTVTLVIAALRNRLKGLNVEAMATTSLPLPAALDDYYLTNRYDKDDRHYKLHLRRADHETLAAIVGAKDYQSGASVRLRENFDYITDMVNKADPAIVHAGLQGLVVVDVCLKRGQDDPQMIFESLNSTGIDLTQADLIRNFVLMRYDESLQSRLYQEHWLPLETAFGNRYRTDFDKFIRDFLVLKLRPSKPLRSDEIYHSFRLYFLESSRSRDVDHILAELSRFGRYYVAFSLGKEQRDSLRKAFARLHALAEVASPVAIALYDFCDRARTLSVDDFLEAIDLLESFVFRRSVCDLESRSLGRVFANLAYRLSEANPLLSLKVALFRQVKNRRFPSDIEFCEALETRDVYDMRTCFYLLDRLENDSKETIDTSRFSIEHVLPQNPELRSEWREMLGREDWKATQQAWLHRLGNLTLTGYNSAYSDRSFAEKKSMADGFDESPLRLNKFIREQEVWTAEKIEERGKLLATKALNVWKPLEVDPIAVKQAELRDLVSQAKPYPIEDVEMDSKAHALFERLRPDVLEIGNDVVELCSQKTITYRVYDFFLEVIPRKHHLSLLLNIGFDEASDLPPEAEDATQHAFVTHATETGGVLFPVRGENDIPAAVRIIRQAYRLISE